MDFVIDKQSSKKYLKACVIVLTAVLLSVPTGAQSSKDADPHFVRNSVYVEALGVGRLYSINYDRRLTKELDFRVGFGTSPYLTCLPLMLNYLAGSHASHLEIGAGVLPNTGPPLWIGTIGYRYQPFSGGYVFRIDFTPYLLEGIHPWRKGIHPWVGISVGRTF